VNPKGIYFYKLTSLLTDTLNRITSNEVYLELCLITEVKTCRFDMSFFIISQYYSKENIINVI